MDFHNLTLHGTQQSSGSDQYPWRSFQAPTRSARWQSQPESVDWENVLEGPGKCKNPILLSEPGQKVVRAIRQLYGPRQDVSQCTSQQG